MLRIYVFLVVPSILSILRVISGVILDNVGAIRFSVGAGGVRVIVGVILGDVGDIGVSVGDGNGVGLYCGMLWRRIGSLACGVFRDFRQPPPSMLSSDFIDGGVVILRF